MSAAPSPLSLFSVRYKVCGDCAAELVTLGARRPPGPHVIHLDERCEAHGELGILHASTVVELSPELVRDWWAARADVPIAPLDLYRGDAPADAELVAKLAAVLLAASDRREADEIASSVICARRVLRAARGR